MRGQIFMIAQNERKDPSSAEDEAVSTEWSGGIHGANTTAWRLRKGSRHLSKDKLPMKLDFRHVGDNTETYARVSA